MRSVCLPGGMGDGLWLILRSALAGRNGVRFAEKVRVFRGWGAILSSGFTGRQ